MSIRVPFAARLAAVFGPLFTRPCPTCGSPVGRLVDVCEACLEHVPVLMRWAFRDARDGRWRDRDGYRIELHRVRVWLADRAAKQGGRHRPKTETTKETS